MYNVRAETLTLKIDQLSFVWKTNGQTYQAVNNLNLEFQSGIPNIICGQSGAGKSTLGLLIARLIEPDSGTIKLNSDSVKTSSENIAYIFQFPETLFFEDTVELETKLLSDTNRDSFKEILKTLDLDYDLIAHLPPYRLSSGQARLVAISLQMARHPKVLIADEPTVNLDWKFQNKIIELLKDWLTPEKILIVITHDLLLIKALGGTSLALANGEIFWQGKTDKITSNDALLTDSGLK